MTPTTRDAMIGVLAMPSCYLHTKNNGQRQNHPHSQASQLQIKKVIYLLWLYNLCSGKQAYFGCTTQQCSQQSNGHRKCFNDVNWKKSALSMHAKV